MSYDKVLPHPASEKQRSASFDSTAQSRSGLDWATIEKNEHVHLWRAIVREATDLARREPLLEAHVNSLVISRSSLAEALAEILFRHLVCSDIPGSKLAALLVNIITDEDSILRKIAADMHAVKNRDPACPSMLHVLLNLKGFHALQIYRVSHCLWLRDRRDLAMTLSNAAARSLGVDIHPAARIGASVMFDHGNGLVIGETAVVDDEVSILHNVTLGGTGKHQGDRHPKIRRGVLLGAGATILGNIEIGEMSKVAAGSVVLKSVPSYCTVAGIPAKIVRQNIGDRIVPALNMDHKFQI